MKYCILSVYYLPDVDGRPTGPPVTQLHKYENILHPLGAALSTPNKYHLTPIYTEYTASIICIYTNTLNIPGPSESSLTLPLFIESTDTTTTRRSGDPNLVGLSFLARPYETGNT